MATKRKRKRRERELGIMRAEKHKETRYKRHKKHGHAWSRNHRDDYSRWPYAERQEGRTFEDEYKLYRRTRGKKGWNPNPDMRGNENPVYLASKSVFGGIKYNYLVVVQKRSSL